MESAKYSMLQLNQLVSDNNIVIPPYQRNIDWTNFKRRNLIDSIFEKSYIPPIVFRDLCTKSSTLYNLVDGQQRIDAIIKFVNNEFRTSSNLPKGYKKKYFRDFTREQRNFFSSLTLRCDIEMCEDDIAERKLFRNLNSCSQLNAPQIRNSYMGDMRDLVVEITLHPFFKKCESKLHPNKKFQIDNLCAELVYFLIHNSNDTTKKLLDDMYIENRIMLDKIVYKKRAFKILNKMNKIFLSEEKYLKSLYVKSIFLFIHESNLNGVTNEDLYSFIDKFSFGLKESEESLIRKRCGKHLCEIIIKHKLSNGVFQHRDKNLYKLLIDTFFRMRAKTKNTPSENHTFGVGK